MQRLLSIGISALLACQLSSAVASDAVLDEIVVGFDLINRNGENVRFDMFEGRNVLLSFGFTHCAHICPMIAANMARVLTATDKNAVDHLLSISNLTADEQEAILGRTAAGLLGIS